MQGQMVLHSLGQEIKAKLQPLVMTTIAQEAQEPMKVVSIQAATMSPVALTMTPATMDGMMSFLMDWSK